MRIVVDHINFQPMSNLQFKLSKGHISCFSSEIDVGDYFILCKVWVGSLQEDLADDLECLAHNISTLTRQSEWPTLIISISIFQLP
jgi:hypothetical protein